MVTMTEQVKHQGCLALGKFGPLWSHFTTNCHPVVSGFQEYSHETRDELHK